MLVQTKALVLHSIKYNDSSLIAHCYTETLGIQSFMLKGILSAKKGKMRKAHFQPLTLLNLQFQHKNKGGLNFIKELKVEEGTCWHDVRIALKWLYEETLIYFEGDFIAGSDSERSTTKEEFGKDVTFTDLR